MRKSGLFLFNIGASGVLIGGAGLDCLTAVPNMILTAASFVIAAVGYRLWAISEQRSALVESERIRKEKEIEATEKIIARAKEDTFHMWITSGRLDG